MAFGDCNSDSDCNGNYLNGNCSIVDWNLYFPSICQFLGIFYHLGPGQGPGPGQGVTLGLGDQRDLRLYRAFSVNICVLGISKPKKALLPPQRVLFNSPVFRDKKPTTLMYISKFYVNLFYPT